MPTRRPLTAHLTARDAQVELLRLLTDHARAPFPNLGGVLIARGFPANTLRVLVTHGALRRRSRVRYDVPPEVRLDQVLGPILRELWPRLFAAPATRRRGPRRVKATAPLPPVELTAEELVANPQTFEAVVKYTQWPEIFRRLEALEARLQQLTGPQLSLFTAVPTKPSHA